MKLFHTEFSKCIHEVCTNYTILSCTYYTMLYVWIGGVIRFLHASLSTVKGGVKDTGQYNPGVFS